MAQFNHVEALRTLDILITEAFTANDRAAVVILETAYDEIEDLVVNQ